MVSGSVAVDGTDAMVSEVDILEARSVVAVEALEVGSVVATDSVVARAVTTVVAIVVARSVFVEVEVEMPTVDG